MTFPIDAKKIKIVFVCDACGENVTIDSMDVPAIGDTKKEEVACPVCLKVFNVVVTNNAANGSVQVEGIDDSDITITVL
jgi:DNA-directed RNA polymerase subunit RPC12/RpoP